MRQSHDLIPNMPEHRLAPLMQNFADAASKAGVFMAATCRYKMRGLVSSPAAIPQ